MFQQTMMSLCVSGLFVQYSTCMAGNDCLEIITQSNPGEVVDGSGVLCFNSQTSICRSFELALEYPGVAFEIERLSFGIRIDEGASVQGTCSIYLDPGGGEPGSPSTLNRIWSSNYVHAVETGVGIIDLPVGNVFVVPTDKVLVVEVSYPPGGNATTAGNFQGESAPTWILAPECGLEEYWTLEEIGFGEYDWYLDVMVIPESCPECPGDLNQDGAVNGLDMGLLLGYWGNTEGLPEGDLNEDGRIDAGDLGLLLTSWGTCPE